MNEEDSLGPSRTRPPTDLRKHRRRTERNMVVGGFVILFVIGGALVWVLYGAGAAVLSWVCLAQASKVSTAEYGIWKNEMELERLQRENAESLAELVDALSVSELEHRALELGYAPPEHRRYLDVPGYSGGVSGGGFATAPRVHETAVIAPHETSGEPAGVARWLEKVIAQLVKR